jgi:hypothetical protein
MTISKNQENALLDALAAHAAIATLARRLSDGDLSAESLPAALSVALAAAPELAPLDESTRKRVLGKLRGRLQSHVPKVVKQAPGERVLAMPPRERDAWRASLARRAVMPVAVLVEQARLDLGFELGHPGRRDLAWDLVNAGVTAVRYAAVVALAAYVRGGPTDPQLNRALVDALARPADGTWSALLFAPEAGAAHSLLAVLARRGDRPACLRCLDGALSTGDLPRGLPFGKVAGLPNTRPVKVQDLAGALVPFRNELVHGHYARERPDDATLEHLATLLDALLAHLEPLLTQPVVLASDEGLLTCNGVALTEIADPAEPLGDVPLEAAWHDQPVLLDGGLRIPLAPWLALADLETAASRAEGESPELTAELGIAELCFFNKFESELLHYLGFAARAQLAHVDLVERARADEAYRSFAAHVEALRLRSAPAGARLRDPILRFDAQAAFHAESFVGRRDAIAAIERFVAERPSPMGLVAAAPGLGKSALLTHFYRKHGAPDAHDGWVFHFAARAEQRDNAALGLRSLVAQIEQQFARNVEGAKKAPPLPWSHEELEARLFASLTALGEAMAAKGKRAVLVLDAIDEQTPRPGGVPESIFGALPEDVPDNVVCLVSVRLDPEGRPVGVEAGALGLPRCSPIPGVAPLLGLTEDDVRELVRDKLGEARPELREAPQAVLDRVCEAARRREDGSLDPFYLRFLADGVRDGSVDLTQPGNVPAGLESFFDALWWGLDPASDFLLHRLLGMLAEMEGFGSDALFADALRKPEDEVARLRHGVNKLLMQAGAGSSEARYGLFHDRFRWYVQGKFSLRDRALALHLPLLEACRRGVGAAEHYAARYTTYHQRALALHEGLTLEERAAYAEELWRTVHDDGFVERSFTAMRDERAVVADFGRAFEVFRPRQRHAPEERAHRAARLTALAERCSRTVSGVANLALARVHDFARDGDAVRVIQIAEREPSIALRWMMLLRTSATMREVGLDPAPLFDAIVATEEAALQWADGAMLERLLAACEAPAEVRAHVLTRVPSKPDVVAEARAERAAAAVREREEAQRAKAERAARGEDGDFEEGAA